MIQDEQNHYIYKRSRLSYRIIIETIRIDLQNLKIVVTIITGAKGSAFSASQVQILYGTLWDLFLKSGFAERRAGALKRSLLASQHVSASCVGAAAAAAAVSRLSIMKPR